MEVKQDLVESSVDRYHRKVHTVEDANTFPALQYYCILPLLIILR